MAIVGTRDCNFFPKEKMKRRLPQNVTLIVSGGASGIDSMAEDLAADLGVPFRKILPDYQAYGRSAPIVRNIEIVSQVDLVLAFWDYSSRGTAHTISACIERQIPVEIIGVNDQTISTSQ